MHCKKAKVIKSELHLEKRRNNKYKKNCITAVNIEILLIRISDKYLCP